MLDIFSTIPVRMKDVSGGYLSAQIQINEKDLFTGLFHLEFNGEQDVLFFWRGRMLAFYRFDGTSWQPLPAPAWNRTIAASRGDLRVLPLPAAGLRLYRLLLESNLNDSAAPREIRARELAASINSGPNAPRLVYVRSDDAAILLLVSAENASILDGVLVSPEEAVTGFRIFNQIQAWGDRICQVFYFEHDPASEGWKVFDIGNSFSAFAGAVLTRYEELVGCSLVTDLNQQINMECDLRNWAISLQPRSMLNQHLFDTSENAARACVTLLGILQKEMGLVIGPRMALQVLQDSFSSLPEGARQLLLARVMPGLQSAKQILERAGAV